MKYYIKSQGKTYGPAEEDKIKQYIASEFFSANSMVSTDLKTWRPIRECMTIPIVLKSVAPPPSIAIKNPGQPPQIVRLSSNNVVNSESRPSSSPFKAIMLIVLFLLLLGGLGGGGYFLFFKNGAKKGADEKSPAGFQQVCQKHQSAVGVVVVTLEDTNGKLLNKIGDFNINSEYPIGTAFAISPNQFATNCHVAYGVKDQKSGVLDSILWKIIVSCAKQNGAKNDQDLNRYIRDNKKEIEEARSVLYNKVRVRNVEIRLAHSGGRSLSVTGVQIHPRYRANTAAGRSEFKNGEFDVAIFTTNEEVKNHFVIAPVKTLHALAAGQEIAYIGFPMEGLADNGNLDLNRPEAVFKQGTINKITDFNNVHSTPEFNKSIIHDIPAAGGASGSPIFLADGKVVAILWGVTHSGSNSQGRVASAVQHNMAVRIDSLDIVKKQQTHDIKEWLGEKK